MWPAFFLPVAGFLKSYWKPLLLVSVILGVVVGSYLKGRNDCLRKQESSARKEMEKRYEDAQEERSRIDHIDNKISTDRATRPYDDSRDSCLLSGDPYSNKCVK